MTAKRCSSIKYYRLEDGTLLSDEKQQWRLGLRRRLVIFYVLCLVIFLKVCLLTIQDSGQDRQIARAFWLLSDTANRTFLQSADWYGLSGVPAYSKPFVPKPIDKQHYLQRRYNPRLYNISCPLLFKGDIREQDRARWMMQQNPKKDIPAGEYLSLTTNCSSFKRSRGYFEEPLSQEEKDYPIAYSILMYKDVNQFERLLRAVYQPQNLYCVHIDLKASPAVQQAVRAITRCFPNVMVPSRLESVFWGHISIIYAEMNCLRELIRYRWRYFINLTGQMFPLHTNLELVRVLKMYNGANDIEGTYDRAQHLILQIRQFFSWRLWTTGFTTMFPTIYPKKPPPFGVKIFKGSNNAALSRAFAKYLLYSPVTRQLMAWFADTLAPDEYLWPTLNHNAFLHAPGAFRGNPETKAFTARASIWDWMSFQKNWSWKNWDCRGKVIREICIFGIGDLPWLFDRPELFANKFFNNFEYVVYDCMEELILNRTLFGHSSFNSTYYEEISFVRHPNLIVGEKEALANQNTAPRKRGPV